MKNESKGGVVPLISLEWLTIQTLNFACWLKVGNTKVKNKKLVKRGRGLSHVTYFLNFGIPVIYPEWLTIQTFNLARRLKVRHAKPQNEK